MFSVVVPTRGDRASLDEAVASVEAQTVDAEIVVELDPDGTGPGATRNRAIARATQPYIATLDDDDLFEPTRLERIAAVVAPDRVVTTNAWVRRDGLPDVRMYPDFNRSPFPTDHASQRVQIVRSNFVFTQSVFARAAWERVGGFSETIRLVDDYDMWLRLIYSGCTAHLVDEVLSVYRMHDRNASSDRRQMLLGESAVVACAPVETFAEIHARDERIQSLVARIDLLVASDAVRSGDEMARVLCRTVAANRRLPARQRLRAALGVVSPAAARAWAERTGPRRS